VLRLLGALALLALPFELVSRTAGGRHAARWAVAAWCCLALVVSVHAARDRLWHETHLTLGDGTLVVEQQIALPPEALARLRGAEEAYVVFDLRVPRGDPSVLSLLVGDRRYEGSALEPTMPRLPESTSTGGRAWKGYPQWWALRLDPATLPASPAEPLRIRLKAAAGADVRLGADRFGAQQRVYEGPSFGERPNMVPLKLEYDGDYRVPLAYPLDSRETRTLVGRDELTELAGVARIRLVTLERNRGWTSWRTHAAPGPRTAFGFFAHSGVRDEATLLAGTRELLRFPLEDLGDFSIAGGEWRLCRRSLGERGGEPYGAFVLTGPTVPGEPLELSVRFLTGMNERRMFFVLDRRQAADELEPHFASCGVPAGVAPADGIAQVTDATSNHYPRDTGRWGVDRVF
jgi:hypothetical protein